MRCALVLVVVAVASPDGWADPVRPLSQPDLSPTRAAGFEVALGGRFDTYDHGVYAEVTGWLDWAVVPWLKLGASASAGGGWVGPDGGDDGWVGYAGLPAAWAQLIAPVGHGVTVAVGGAVAWLGAAQTSEELMSLVRRLERWRRPAHMVADEGDDEVMTSFDASVRHAGDRHYAQLTAAANPPVLEGAELLAFHVTAGAGWRLDPRRTVAGTVHWVPVRGEQDYHVEAELALEAGLTLDNRTRYSIYVPLQDEDGLMVLVALQTHWQ